MNILQKLVAIVHGEGDISGLSCDCLRTRLYFGGLEVLGSGSVPDDLRKKIELLQALINSLLEPFKVPLESGGGVAGLVTTSLCMQYRIDQQIKLVELAIAELVREAIPQEARHCEPCLYGVDEYGRLLRYPFVETTVS